MTAIKRCKPLASHTDEELHTSWIYDTAQGERPPAFKRRRRIGHVWFIRGAEGENRCSISSVVSSRTTSTRLIFPQRPLFPIMMNQWLINNLSTNSSRAITAKEPSAFDLDQLSKDFWAVMIGYYWTNHLLSFTSSVTAPIFLVCQEI